MYVCEMYACTFTDYSSMMAAVASTSLQGTKAKGKRWLIPTAVGVTQSDHAGFFIAEWEVAVASGPYCAWKSQLLTDSISICNVPGTVTYGSPYTLVVKFNMSLILG